MSSSSLEAQSPPSDRKFSRPWVARLLAMLIGIDAALGVFFTGWQLMSFSGWSFLLLLGAFNLFCSVVGVLGAIGLWRFKWWGWWIAAWYFVFSVFGALAPFVVFPRWPEFDLVGGGWLLVCCMSLAYLFTASAWVAYRVAASRRMAAFRIIGAAALCTALQFGAVGATWLTN